MLKTRLLTAAVLLPLVVAGILLLPTAYVAVVLSIFLMIGAWEWGRFTRLAPSWAHIFYALFAGLVMIPVYQLLSWSLWTDVALALAVAWWLLAFLLLLRFPRVWDLSVGHLAPALGLGLLLVETAFWAIVYLHGSADGPAMLLWFFVIVWAADTGAYFAGRFWGKSKLAPSVSPGKTRQGAYGGILLAVLAALLGACWFGFSGWQMVAVLVLGGLTGIASIVGDLSISMFKRQAGIKDSGSLFPGHGGVLDRLDSVLAAAPIFVLGLSVIGLLSHAG